MNRIENSRQKKIHEIVSIVKLLSLLFSGSLIFNKYLTFQKATISLYDDTFNIVTLGIFISIIVLIYQTWMISSQKFELHEKPRFRDFVEIIVFIGVFTALIIYSGGHVSQYKFLYLFIITTTTIQFGMTYGITIACISSVVILTIDLFSVPLDDINIHFQNDLILAGIFILTAWLLGYYVKVEKEYRDTMTDLANNDELTGVYNHRYFHEALKRGIEQSENTVTSTGLLLIDIDYFKHYNDLYGHQAGDKVLKSIGQILKDSVREQDIVSRYGGEEFAIILPDTNEEQAFPIGERVRQSVEQAHFEGEENQPNGKLTVSVGVSSFPEKAKTNKSLIDSADDALYRAKFFNKNRVETYHSILEELKKDIDEEHIDLITSIKTLISVINAKDRYTYGHTERVVLYCEMLADHLGIGQEDKKTLKYGSYLHDIGKIHISKEILNKKMPLTDEEWELLKQHPMNGVEIINPVESLDGVTSLILHHHERYDGRGYPDGLSGDEIPYLGRILSIADSFDAMTSNRPYKDRRTYEDAIMELKRCSGSQFDPDMIEKFIEIIDVQKEHLDSIML